MSFYNKTTMLRWNNFSKRYYESKGYKFTKINELFEVKVEDLMDRSNAKIIILCDYCGEKITRTYNRHMEMKSNQLSNKDSCVKCIGLKIKDEMIEKQKLGLLKPDDKYYWEFKENRIKELQKYINTHGTVELIHNNKFGKTIYLSIMRHDKLSLREFIENDLKINWEYVSSFDVKSPCKELDVIKIEIDKFISDFGYFPTLNDFKYTLNISQRIVDHHGGIFELKRKMGWEDKSDYLDDNRFYNRSSFEYMVAQFLIHNGITYKREQNPFIETNHASDFTIYTDDGECHVEVWGFDVKNNSYYSKKYYEIKK